MQEHVGISLKRIQHIGIPVRNIEVSKSFYSSLGFISSMQSAFTIPEGDGICEMMMQGEISLELYQLPDTLIQSDIVYRKPGNIDHIAIDVKDIDTVFEFFKSNNFTVIQDAPMFLPFWKNGVKFFHIVGPDGERLELNEIL